MTTEWNCSHCAYSNLPLEIWVLCFLLRHLLLLNSSLPPNHLSTDWCLCLLRSSRFGICQHFCPQFWANQSHRQHTPRQHLTNFGATLHFAWKGRLSILWHLICDSAPHFARESSNHWHLHYAVKCHYLTEKIGKEFVCPSTLKEIGGQSDFACFHWPFGAFLDLDQASCKSCRPKRTSHPLRSEPGNGVIQRPQSSFWSQGMWWLAAGGVQRTNCLSSERLRQRKSCHAELSRYALHTLSPSLTQCQVCQKLHYPSCTAKFLRRRWRSTGHFGWSFSHFLCQLCKSSTTVPHGSYRAQKRSQLALKSLQRPSGYALHSRGPICLRVEELDRWSCANFRRVQRQRWELFWGKIGSLHLKSWPPKLTPPTISTSTASYSLYPWSLFRAHLVACSFSHFRVAICRQKCPSNF